MSDPLDVFEQLPADHGTDEVTVPVELWDAIAREYPALLPEPWLKWHINEQRSSLLVLNECTRKSIAQALRHGQAVLEEVPQRE
ncbi:MAG: hypothetical protein RL385_5386 [Pseudomonadota bacterium]|jgi:hypothetical protein